MATRKESGRATPGTIIIENFLKTNDLTKLAVNGGYKRTVAKILQRQYPDIWKDVEAARQSVRGVLHAHGRRDKHKVHNFEPLHIELESKEDFSWQSPFLIPSGITEMAVMGDFHGCYMNERAVNEALEISAGVKTLLINGDLLDNTWLSRWAKDKDAPMLSTEFAFVRELLEKLAKRFTKIYFKCGNHDQWLSRYLAQTTEQFQKEIGNAIQEDITLERFLKFDELGITKIHSLQEIRFGDLSILHGHERAGSGSPINLAQGILTWWQRYEKRWDVKILVNHHHWRDQTVKTNFDERIGYAWTNGCLCDLRPKYSPYGRHNHGMALATQKDGVADVQLFEV